MKKRAIATAFMTTAFACSDAPAPDSAQAPSPPAQRPSGGNPGDRPASIPSRPAPAPSADPAPRAVVRAVPDFVDFGFVRPHTTLERTIALVNDGDTPLRIGVAVPSCQCTTVDLDGKVIPARGRLEFPISMKVSSTGVKLANLQIAVEGVDSIIRVELRAEVVYSIRAVTQNQPGGAFDPYIDAATNPARVRGEAVIESLDGAPFKVLSVGMKPPRFVDWDPSQPPRASYRVRYDVSAKDCASMPRYLIVETDRADCPLIDMRVRHECTHIRPRIPFAEFRANAGVLSPSAPGHFEIEIKRMGAPAQPRGQAAAPGRVLSVASSRPDLTAELVDQVFDGENILAKVRLTPKAGTLGVMLFPVRFTVAAPGGQGTLTEDLLVYCKAVE